MKNRVLIAAIFLILILFIVPFSTNSSTLPDNADERIQGVARFLIERSNENFMYIFSKRIRNNPYMIRYFPNSVKILENTKLELALTNQSLWKESIEKDFMLILSTTLKNLISKDPESYKPLPKPFFDELTEVQGEILSINKTVQVFKKEYWPSLNKEELKVVNRLLKNTDPNNIKNYKKILQNIKKDLSESSLSHYMMYSLNKEVSKKYNKNHNNLIDNLNNLKKTIEEDVALINTLSSDLVSLVQMAQKRELTIHKKIKELYDSFNKEKSILYILKKNTKIILNTYKDLKKKNLIQMSFSIITIIENHIKDNSNSFKRFKRYILFLSQLSAAKTSDEVCKILQATMLPSVSFSGKRNDDFNFSINSYLGGQIGATLDPSEGYLYRDRFFLGLFAPVGLELSFPYRGYSFSLFGSILDCGNIVHSALYKKNYDFSYNDILSPGIYLIFGLKDYPISIGSGFSYGQVLKYYYDSSDTNQEHIIEKRINVFVAFDMPLFAIF